MNLKFSQTGANLAGGMVYWPWKIIPKVQTLCISDMDICRGLRWISASNISNMMLWHHFHSTSDPLNSQIWGQKGAPICIWLWDSNQCGSNTLHISDMDVWSCLRVNISLSHNLMTSFLLHKWTSKFPKLGLTWLVEWYKDEGAPIYGLEKSYQRSKHFAYLIWMFAGVWDGYQPQTWCYDIISTPQVTSWIPKSGANLAGGMLYEPPYAFETAPMAQTFWICQILIWMYEVVWGGYRPQPWCYKIIFTPYTQSRIPRSVANLAGVTVCVPPCPWDSIPMAETLCIYLICMYEVVRGGYQPQTRCNVIIYIPHETQNSQTGANLAGVMNLMSTKG